MPHTKTLWVKDEYLQPILSGRKTVEVRVAYSNIARLEPGDRLLLNGQYPYLVTAIRRYPDFEALVAAEEGAERLLGLGSLGVSGLSEGGRRRDAHGKSREDENAGK